MAFIKNVFSRLKIHTQDRNKILVTKYSYNKYSDNGNKRSFKFHDGAVDPDIQFHSNLGEEWWWSNENLLIHLNEVRIPFIINGIYNSHLIYGTSGNINNLKNINILDVGCGAGILSESLARLEGNVVGLDPSTALINIARKHAKYDFRLEKYLRYEATSINDFAKSNVHKFDVVIASEVIEHISNKEKFLENCLNCLKPQGALFITTPNKTLMSKIFIVKLAERLGFVPIGTHNFDKFITFEELKNLLTKLGCTIKQTQGMVYNPITQKFILSYYNILMYAVYAQKISSFKHEL
ncbi:hypothetical protein PGB90_009600 [Kerria lacca]